jgi:hypothetical protein
MTYLRGEIGPKDTAMRHSVKLSRRGNEAKRVLWAKISVNLQEANVMSDLVNEDDLARAP